ncbi:MAG: hypothetical protein IT373_25205 [Polyangiaceae bacterium]|nr:hypothetical protein [Polyangiaceae bacterium]
MKGTIRAALDISSYRLTSLTPIEIRDSSLALVCEIRNGGEAQLTPGVYQVRAVMDDGRAHARLVTVTEGKETKVEFSKVDPAGLMTAPSSARFTRSAARDRDGLIDYGDDEGGGRAGGERGDEAWAAPDSDVCRIVALEGAVLDGAARGTWELVPAGTLTEVPHAVLDLGGRRRRVCLPLNPCGHRRAETACVLRLEHYREGTEARAWIHPERKVSSAVQHMLAEGRVFHAQSVVAGTADDMLQAKYSDPVGAALGALVMYRAGTLRDRLSWLENLARDFAWLPDGAVLLGALWLQDEATRAAGARLLLGAAGRRPLFTTSYSVLLDTLRRWPLDDSRAEARAALTVLARDAGRVDWNAFTFTCHEEP